VKASDPYDDNEKKGTRIPEYSKVSHNRDVYGELGWVPNFNQKDSKNNDHRHGSYKEYFDKPKNYNTTFTNTQSNNNEFFRQKAPGHSVAHQQSQSSIGFQSRIG